MRESSAPSDAEDPHDPVLAFGPVAIVLCTAVAGVGTLIALTANGSQQRIGTLIGLAGAVGVSAIALSLHRRWRASQARRREEADESLLRSQQFAATQSAIISMISHELRTPLQAITTNVEYLESAVPSRSDLSDAVARLNRAATLIDGRLKNLAEYARATNEATPRSDAFALRELLLRIVDDYRSQADLRRQVLRTEFAPGAEAAMQGDPIRLNQIVANYVFNAIQHSVADDTIIIRSHFSPVVAAPQRMLLPTVEVEVVDHGPGISADVQQSLWAPFITTKKQGEANSNSGLGLAVVKLLADVARWEVGVRQTPGGGATFYVRLPVKPRRAQRP
jgi:signal transduction histidine kinase